MILTTTFGQTTKTIYQEGLEKAQAGKLEEAIELFSMAIKLHPDDHYSWYNRGIAKSMLDLYEEALIDFDKTIELDREYKKGYLNRGIVKKHLTDYDGALTDYSYALQLDSNYADAYFNRGVVHQLFKRRDAACTDFNKAYELGLKRAESKIDQCKDTTATENHTILRLTKTADNDAYGFTSENPIRVGRGPDGGAENNRAYLNLLRDATGKPIRYERKGSCCHYESKNSLFGMAMLDLYEITYFNKKGKKTTASVYISFYDYEEPQILFGFKTVGQK